MDTLFPLGETLTALEAGALILYPTDTIWGLGCDATNPDAVAKVLALKDRPIGQGLISLVSSVEMLRNHVDDLHPRLETLLAHHVRPLTMIYPHAVGLAAGVTASDGSAGIRVTNDTYCKSLIQAFGRPIVSTSANLRGQPFPTGFGSISSEVLQAIDHVVKYRQRETSERQPSLVARWNDQNEIEPIRE